MIFVGCQQQVNVEMQTEHQSDKTSEWEIVIDKPVFSSVDPEVEKSCISFNETVTALLLPFQDSVKAQAKEYVKLCVEAGDEPVGPYQLMVEDSVFIANAQYISIRLRIYSFTGGAHGMTTFKSLNYDVKNQKYLTQEEIFDFGKIAEINEQLKANFHNPDNCFTEMPTLEGVSVVNFSTTAVDFTYEQYLLGAYACGVAEISVPRVALKDMLLLK
ncbi:MAG: DUF4163 domain-containing protein [Odoribacter sp.]